MSSLVGPGSLREVLVWAVTDRAGESAELLELVQELKVAEQAARAVGRDRVADVLLGVRLDVYERTLDFLIEGDGK